MAFAQWGVALSLHERLETELKTVCHETFPVMVTIQEDYIAQKTASMKRRKQIDMCIAPLVNALENHGIHMRGSCCGHGLWDGEIILQDGRKLTISQEVIAMDVQGEYEFDIDFRLLYFWDTNSLESIAHHIQNPFETS